MRGERAAPVADIGTLPESRRREQRVACALAPRTDLVLLGCVLTCAATSLGFSFNDLTTAHTDPNRDRPTRTTGWMKPKMSAALQIASNSEALQTQSDACVQRLRSTEATRLRREA